MTVNINKETSRINNNNFVASTSVMFVQLSRCSLVFVVVLFVVTTLSLIEGVNAAGGGVAIDWIQVCKELCHAGEGGILCNCDMIPLRQQQLN
jgi:hypothetical protein